METYDCNECRFSGRILELKDVATRTGTRMASLKIQCHKEQIRAVCFKEKAELLLENFETGDQIEFTGRLQSSNWESNGTKYFSFQINISDIAGQEVQAEPRTGKKRVSEINYVSKGIGGQHH